MTQLLSPILGKLGNNHVQFWCVGCNQVHHIPVAVGPQTPTCWGYNGNPLSPTFSPSISISRGHYSSLWKGPNCYCNSKAPSGDDWGFTCGVCHFHVVNGILKYLGDCTHSLAGQNVPMVPLLDHL